MEKGGFEAEERTDLGFGLRIRTLRSMGREVERKERVS
jgi:hypothetical protein